MRLSALTMLLLMFSVSVSSAGLLMSPYLQALTPTSVYVMVECNSQDTVTVRYGSDTTYGLSAKTETIAVTTGSTYVHRILVQGLSPATLYHYCAGQGNLYSADSHFTTGALPGMPFRFAWMADCRTGSVVYDSVMTHLASTQPLLALYGGDLCIDSSYTAWKNEFFRSAQATVGGTVPWVNAAGNHEGWNTNTKAFTHAPAGSVAQDHFSFDCGDLHVLVLNSELPLVPGTEQYTFADNDLAGTKQIWKLVMLHKPAYCSGGHGEDAGVKALTAGVFEKRGVDVVLAGHAHFYQHNLVNDIHHMVIGSAGAPLHAPTNASYTLKSAMQYNWAMCDVTPASLSMFVFNDQGTPLDTLFLVSTKTYGVQLGRIAKDTLRVTARTQNPLSHTLKVMATLRDESGAFIDSLSLEDDGLHGDGEAGDGFWGNLCVPVRDASIYVSIRTDDLTAGTSRTLPNAATILFTRGALIALDASATDLGKISNTILQYDTTFMVRNIGFAADSITVLLDPINVIPETAVNASPTSCFLVAGDSQKVTLSIRPQQLVSQYYYSMITVQPKAGLSQSALSKSFTFQIVITGGASISTEIPKEFVLRQNYPNPFNPNTIVKFELPKSSVVRLSIFDILGREVSVLVNDRRDAGVHQVIFDGSNLTSGVYFYRMHAWEFVQTRKLLLVR